MTDRSEELAAIERAVAELLPSLTERLERHGLGEIEVRQGELRLRVTAGAPRQRSAESGAADEDTARAARAQPTGAGEEPASPTSERDTAAPMPVPSPGVGYFIYADGLGPGLRVERGAALGYVDVLGVRHDVRAPRTGTVRSLAAESGEAVEYGQVLLEVEQGS